MGKSAGSRLAYADLLRVLATVGVIVIHVCGVWFHNLPRDSVDFQIYNLYDALVRWSVPMFVMLSGMFLLDPQKELTWRGLFCRHILRLLAALLVWGSLYAVLDHGFNGPGGGLTWAGVWDGVRHVFRSETHYHLWFLYMMLGLYLVTPILRAFVRGAGQGELRWFLLLSFLLGMLIPTLLSYFPSPALKGWVGKLDVRMVLGYVGYFVAGYYFKAHPPKPAAECLICLLGVLGAAATVWQSDALYAYTTPNVAAMTVAVFVLFRRVPGGGRVSGLSRITFGIYLAHDLFLMLYRDLGLSALPLSPLAAVPLVTAALFLPALAVAWLVRKLPLIGRYLT